MKISTTRQGRRVMLAGALACMAFAAHAEVFFSGQTKGVAGSQVDLSIHARAGTVFDALDIVPDLAGVAAVLHLVSFEPTAAYIDGGSGACTDQACAFFYLTGKTFAQDTLLARYRFTIDPAAPLGVVPFDTGVVVDATPLQLPSAQQFEVVAVPEPSSWMLLLFGSIAIPLALRRAKQVHIKAPGGC